MPQLTHMITSNTNTLTSSQNENWWNSLEKITDTAGYDTNDNTPPQNSPEPKTPQQTPDFLSIAQHDFDLYELPH
jgi:hypothetical protein